MSDDGHVWWEEAVVYEVYRSWRAILDSYPADGFPGSRTAIGEVWYDRPETLMPYLAPGALPQVFNFQLILPGFSAAGFRDAIDSALSLTGGSRAPWVIGNHDVPRPASRYRLDEGYSPEAVRRLISLGDRNAGAGARRARAVALLLLALPGSAYLYQGEELGLVEVTGIPAGARQDPRFRRTAGQAPGRDGCRVPIPWTRTGIGFGFSPTDRGACPAEPWLPQPPDWGRYSIESQLADERSFLSLYRMALRLRRDRLPGGKQRRPPCHRAEERAEVRGHLHRRPAGRLGLRRLRRRPPFLRILNTFGTARRVADALRRSPEFRSL